MSTQNSPRLFLLFALLASICQLGLSQESYSDVGYADNYLTNSTYSQELIDTRTSSSTREVKPVFDFAKGVVLPTFTALDEYVSENLDYPTLATDHAVEGSVVLSLKLSPTGEVVSATVLESLGFGCDEAALTLANSMPNWTPASNYGRAVGSKQLVAIDFVLK